MAGRTRRRNEEKEQFWRQAVNGHAASGLSVRQYCVEREVTEPSFFAWRRELARRDATVRTRANSSAKRIRGPSTGQRPAPLRFAQLQIAPSEPAGGACIEIELPTGIRKDPCESVRRDRHFGKLKRHAFRVPRHRGGDRRGR